MDGVQENLKSDQQEIILHGQYRHYKKGHVYEVIGFALHSETYEEMVVYKALYDCEKFGNQQIWVRPKSMFSEKILYEGQYVSRFISCRQDNANQDWTVRDSMETPR